MLYKIGEDIPLLYFPRCALFYDLIECQPLPAQFIEYFPKPLAACKYLPASEQLQSCLRAATAVSSKCEHRLTHHKEKFRLKLLKFTPSEVNPAGALKRVSLPESFEPSLEYALLVLSILPTTEQEKIYRTLAVRFANSIAETNSDQMTIALDGV